MESEKNQPNPQATDPTQNNILLRIKTGYDQHTNLSGGLFCCSVKLVVFCCFVFSVFVVFCR